MGSHAKAQSRQEKETKGFFYKNLCVFAPLREKIKSSFLWNEDFT